MQQPQMAESILTGMLYCLAGSLIAGVVSSGLLMLLVLALN